MQFTVTPMERPKSFKHTFSILQIDIGTQKNMSKDRRRRCKGQMDKKGICKKTKIGTIVSFQFRVCLLALAIRWQHLHERALATTPRLVSGNAIN